MRERTLVAIVPVREESRRPKKNSAPFVVPDLLRYTMYQLKSVSESSRIVVSSDSELMLGMVR